jgi:glutathione synthase/RimK-type ligase-like ATP-grasp enzyme
MPDVVLVTGRDMPHGPEAETPLLMAELRGRGVDAVIEPWGSEAAVAAPLVVIRTTWDYTSCIDEFLSWLRSASTATTVVNPAAIIEWNAHKRYLLDLAYAAVPVLPTIVVERGSDEATVRSALEEHDGDVVIKPAISVGAFGTIRAGAGDPAAFDHLTELTAVGDALVQPFEPSVTNGEMSLIYFGGEFSHAVRKVPAAGDYRVQVFYGGENQPHPATTDELEVGRAALAAVGADVTYARVDLVMSERGPELMELELIEPQLFLEYDGAAARYADLISGLL